MDDSDRKPHIWTSIVNWLLWLCLCLMVASPSILFAMAEALPKTNQNGYDFDLDLILKMCHYGAPFFSTFIVDLLLAGLLSRVFSKATGLKADRLLMMMKLCSEWLSPVVATVLLHENCAAGWKHFFWKVCRDKKQAYFDWKVFDDVILTTQEICHFDLQDFRWFTDGACSRSVVESMGTFLIKKTLLKAILIPSILALAFHLLLGRNEFHSERTRRCFSGFLSWLKGKVTKTMNSMPQHVQLTTWLEIAVIWGPLVPLLSIALLAAVATNFLLVQFALSHVGLSTDANDTNDLKASVSYTYLHIAVITSGAMQIWYVLSTKMLGGFLLLPVQIFVMFPQTLLRPALTWLPLSIQNWLKFDETPNDAGPSSIELAETSGGAGFQEADVT
ncbi:unnamed protein product [Durusdinium trenchii]|uniref:CSC1/OSCA1-like 7TM region domain-containing protein n=1 Tax=Durusdinium trenchii TaxID=1381693 RepID=A0ABP0KK75_9DINO